MMITTSMSTMECAGGTRWKLHAAIGLLLVTAGLTMSPASERLAAAQTLPKPTAAQPADTPKPAGPKPAASSSQPADKPAPTRLTPDANGTVSTIRDTVIGYNSRGYVITARKGQTLTVALKSASSSLYMNVFAPNEETATFNGSLADTPNLATVKIAADGDYRIDVYLFRNAARRGSKAPFTLDVSVK